MSPPASAHTLRYEYTAHRVYREIIDNRGQVIDSTQLKRGPADPAAGTIVERPFPSSQPAAPEASAPSRTPARPRRRAVRLQPGALK